MAALDDFRTVLITDKIDPICKEVLTENGIDVVMKPGLAKEDILKEISQYDGLIVRSATKVTEEVINASARLKLIGRAGTGVDNIDVKAASKRGIFVMNTPGGNTLSAAEHTCALIAAMARNIGQGYASMREGKWERSKLMGCELNGKTLGIIGLGRIGREVAIRMKSYGMKIVGYDPIVSAEEAASYGIEYYLLDKMWPLVDFITIHTPLLPHLRGLLSKKTFQFCKDGVRIVNVARSGLVDESDLLDALNSGKVGGAALDVFVSEPPTDTSAKLVQHPKVLCTPHLGASTAEAQKRVAVEIAEQIADAVKGKPMIGLVNAPFLMNMGKPEYKCWLSLGKRLAKILRCISEGYASIEIEATGSLLKGAAGSITASVACGFIGQDNGNVNSINALEMFKGNGVDVSWKHAVGDDANQLSLSLNSSPAIKLTGVAIDDSILLTKFNGVCLSGPIALDCNTFFYAKVDQSEFFKLAAESGIKIGSFVQVADRNAIFGTLIDSSEERLPKSYVTCSF